MRQEGESMNTKQESHLSRESTDEIRILEQQESNLWRGASAKRLAGWTRDASTEEIASWSVEAERISREVEAEKRKLQEAIEKVHNERRQDVGRWLGWSGRVSVVVEVQTRILPAGSDLRFGKGSRLSNGVTDPVILEVLSWNVAGL